MLYAGANRMTATRMAVLDLPEANAMRAPGEATGHMALEIAMDELAEKLGIDPVELRIRNDTQVCRSQHQPARPQAASGGRNDQSPGTVLAAPARRMPALGASASAGAAQPAPAQVRDGRVARRHGRRRGVPRRAVTKSAARVRLDRAAS
jgi:xanthine dehydrogenase YagR molybdenum-binding subunit